MNELQIEHLLKQLTRIAEVLELIQDSDSGSLSGIESAVWQIELAIRGKEEQ